MFNLLYLRISCTRISVINKLQFVYQGLKGNSKVKDCTFCKTYHTSLKNPIKVTHSRYKESVKQSKQNINILNPNTNVQNNVLLYKMDANYFLFMRFFAFGALMFSATLMYISYDESLITLWRSDISFKEYFRKNGLSLIYFYYGGLMGPLIFFLLYMTSARFVKYIILHKGGEEISIITYHLLKEQVIVKIPAYEVQSVIARRDMKTYVPMKIKGKKFFYLVDHNGTFLNTALFDNTIGTAKNWHK